MKKGWLYFWTAFNSEQWPFWIGFVCAYWACYLLALTLAIALHWVFD